MIISTEGEESNGKTTFGYTGPLPVVGLAFDMGAERAIQGGMARLFDGLSIDFVEYDRTKAPVSVWRTSGADVTIFKLPAPIQLDSTRVRGMSELWGKFVALAADAIGDPNVGSIQIDTGTIARRIRADAHLQNLQEKNEKDGQQIRERLQQIEWGAANDAIRDIYTSAQGVGKNLIVAHHLTDERQEFPITQPNGTTKLEQRLTGNRLLEGLSQTYRYVDVAIRLSKFSEPVNGVPHTRIRATVKKCGYNLDLEGMTQDDPTWNSLATWIMASLGMKIKIPLRE